MVGCHGLESVVEVFNGVVGFMWVILSQVNSDNPESGETRSQAWCKRVVKEEFRTNALLGTADGGRQDMSTKAMIMTMQERVLDETVFSAFTGKMIARPKCRRQSQAVLRQRAFGEPCEA